MRENRDANKYSDVQLDELAGGLLFAGDLKAGLGLVLDTVRSAEDADLLDGIRLMPDEPAAAILAALELAVRGVSIRLAQVSAVLNKHIVDLTEGTPSERDELDAAFDSLMEKTFGEQAKKDGLA